MSLSEAPAVQISYHTAQDISDEILGGTIQFCKETGYKQNPMMLTFLWAGFLIATKKEIDENDLLDNVMECYTYSLGKVFHKLSGDINMQNQIHELRKHYWENLSQDFTSLRTEPEISVFFQIATKVNGQGDPAAAYLLKMSPNQPFLRISSTICSNIYRILHQIDNNLCLEYRGMLSPSLYATVRPQTSTTRSQYIPQQKTELRRSTSSNGNKNNTVSFRRILLGVILGIVLIPILGCILGVITANSHPDLTPVPEPQSGAILSGMEYSNGSIIKITASSGSSYVVKLKTASGITRLSFYVRAGDTVTVGVPTEYLYVYFASGDTWYGNQNLFGKYTSYSKDENICDFAQTGWEYVLQPVNNGNFSETHIDADDF